MTGKMVKLSDLRTRWKYNPYPNNPLCQRPQDSGMRIWCACLGCVTYAREQDRLSSMCSSSNSGAQDSTDGGEVNDT